MTEDILEEALRLTSGDRQHQYGPPDQDFARTAKMWSALKGVEFEARDVAMFLICLKLSRETHQRKRDNSVDIAGYARCLHICNEAEQLEGPQENTWPDFLPPPPALPEGRKTWEYLGKFADEEIHVARARCIRYLYKGYWCETDQLSGDSHHIEAL